VDIIENLKEEKNSLIFQEPKFDIKLDDLDFLNQNRELYEKIL
jgi:hypothetical protein